MRWHHNVEKLRWYSHLLYHCSAEDKSKEKAQGAILKSFNGKLIADFRDKNANVQVTDKTLSWTEAVRKG